MEQGQEQVDHLALLLEFQKKTVFQKSESEPALFPHPTEFQVKLKGEKTPIQTGLALYLP